MPERLAPPRSRSIGPAVNLVSRIEGVAKALDRPILVSRDFARALGDGVVSLGLLPVAGGGPAIRADWVAGWQQPRPAEQLLAQGAG
jgi:class 3 adenylate cyclase